MSERAPGDQARRRLSSEERREAFIVKAIEFFSEEGFESSTRELARRLGVTQPLLYRYFPSKDDLIAEVYQAVYLRRWRPEWDAMLVDRSLPMRARLERFYGDYCKVVFQRDWMRIFMFAALKGGDLNRRYLGRVREQILVPIAAECRIEAGLDGAPTEAEVEYAWVMHGGIYYQGIRAVIYELPLPRGLDFAIATSIGAFLAELPAVRAAVSAG